MLLVIAVFSGVLLGILINYLCDVLPFARRPVQPVCTTCYSPKKWGDYFLLRRCSNCNKKISFRNLIVLLLFPLATGFIYIFPSIRLGFWGAMILLVYFCIVAIIDIEHRVILEQISIFGAFLGLITGILLHGIWSTVLGGAAGFCFMLILYYIGILFSRFMSKIKKQEIEEIALGFGDVNMSGVIGLILGWPGVSLGLLLAIILGGLFSGGYLVFALISRRYKAFSAIPYAPFLVLSVIILLFRPY